MTSAGLPSLPAITFVIAREEAKQLVAATLAFCRLVGIRSEDLCDRRINRACVGDLCSPFSTTAQRRRPG
jgi:hypothetical protein